ncbi:hypothetical protein OTU49_009748, partial [Cherax quadricarinatus]
SGSHRRHLQHSASRREVNAAWVTKVNAPPRKQHKDNQRCSTGLHQQPGNSTKPTMSWILGRLTRLQESSEQREVQPAPPEHQLYYHSPARHNTGVSNFQLDAFDYSRE